MLWLPAPTLATSPMAVADASAVALESALLEPQAAAAQLRSGLLVDPWFCHWFSAWPDSDATTIDALASWFAEALPQRLANLDDAPPAWTRPDSSQQRLIAGQAADMLAHAVAGGNAGADLGSSERFLSAILRLGECPRDGQVASEYLVEHPGVEWRLPRLVKRLIEGGPGNADFESRLERAKLEAMKELAYGASHEVNNPLANISGRAQAMLREETEPKKRRLLAAIDAQAIRAHEMISDLMLFARPPAIERQPIDLGQLITTVLSELRPAAQQRHITLDVAMEGDAPRVVSVDPTQVAVAVKALVQNGIDAVGSDGRVTISCGFDDQCAELLVTDTGPGIAETAREHLFDPFYSGREAGRGLGFGLSKCWRIATDHGGSVDVEATSPAGTTMRLRLPADGGER